MATEISMRIETYLTEHGLLGQEVAVIPDQLYREAEEETKRCFDSLGLALDGKPRSVMFHSTTLVGAGRASRQLAKYYKVKAMLMQGD